MQKRGLVIALVLGVLFISLSFASAFSFSDFFKGLFEGKVTGNVIDNSNLPSGLIAYYPFDGNALDSSGNGKNGVANGEVNYVSGKFGQAMDSSSGYVSIANPFGSQTVDYSSSFSASIWYNQQGNTIANIPIWYFGGQRVNANEFMAALFKDATAYGCSQGQVGFGVGKQDVSWKVVCSTSMTDDSNWHHAVVVYANQNMALYLEGVLQGSASASLTGSAMTGPLYLAGSQSGNADSVHTFSGLLDEFMLFNRALSADEVQTLYTGQSQVGNQTIVQNITNTNVTVQNVNNSTNNIDV